MKIAYELLKLVSEIVIEAPLQPTFDYHIKQRMGTRFGIKSKQQVDLAIGTHTVVVQFGRHRLTCSRTGLGYYNGPFYYKMKD